MQRKLLIAIWTILIIFSSCNKEDTIVNNQQNVKPTSIFSKSFGSNLSDLVIGARQTVDNGIVVCGYTIASAFGDNDIFVTKLDDSARVVWSKIIGSSGNDVPVYMDTTLDGGFIICGTTNSFSSTFDPFVFKIDNSGNIVWARYYNWSGADIGNYVIPTSDYGYILTGSMNTYGAGGYDVYSLKLDETGNIMWGKAYGGILDDVGIAIRATDDGGFLISGNTYSFGNSGDVFILKLYGDGVLNWSKTYGGTLLDNAKDMASAPGGFVICGSTSSFGIGNEDGYIFSIDIGGNILWSKTFGGMVGEDDRFYQVKSIPGGGFILSGSVKNTAGNNEDFALLRLYGDGAFNWMKSFGSTGTDISTSIALKIDGGFIAGGYTSSFGAGVNDAYILSLKPDGIFCQQDNVVNPNAGAPQTETTTPQTIQTDINYETVTAGFNSGDFNVSQNTHCLSSP